ncbi:MAG: hypothetical protein ACT4P0_03680 [Panacagrimonas sp.]
MSRTASGTQPKAAKPSAEKKRSATIELPADLGIEQACVIRDELCREIDTPSVTVVGNEVARIHAAALQLFCLFVQARSHAGHDTVWDRPSEVLRSSAALLGLSPLLQLARDNA